MTVSSNKIYEKSITAVKNNPFAKDYIVNQLLLIIEHYDDISIRCDCLKALEDIDFKSNKLFFDLENLLISDSEDEIRKHAAIIIGKKFNTQGIDPLIFSILHEERYDNLLTILLILEKFKVSEIHEILLRKLTEITGLNVKNLKCNTSNQLIQIFINQLTLSCLKRKFNKLEYKQEKGYIQELDFSKVDNKILDWRYREMIQEHTELHGIKHLTQLIKVIPFALRWALRNDFTMQCQVELLKALSESNEGLIKNSLIFQIRNIKDSTFRKSIEDLEEKKGSISNLSTNKLTDILLNYLVIQFLKRKAPDLRYELKEGMVCTLSIEDAKLIKIPKFIELLTSLNSLRLIKCCIYEIPDFMGNLKELNNLELDNNKISILPDSISELKFLKNLSLKNNRTHELPYSLKH